MDWMLSHEDELDAALASQIQEPNPLATELNTTNPSEIVTAESSVAPVAKSIRCDDCGKLFKTNEEVEFHASKSGKYLYFYDVKYKYIGRIT